MITISKVALVLGFTSVACGDPKSPVTSDAAPVDTPATPADAAPIDTPAIPDGGALACVPHVTPRGVTVRDASGRIRNARGIHLVDWDGFLANPAETLTLRPPADLAFPATATVTANHARLYFDLPSGVSATGPTKAVRFDTADTTVPVRLGIFPDRDGTDEHYTLTVTFDGADPRAEAVPITIHDQDQNRPLLTTITVDFSKDQTGFFATAAPRAVIQQAADDWAYFLDDMHLDPVPATDEHTFIWDPDGFVMGSDTTNAAPYTGFLLYAYGIHSSALRSGGEGSYSGKPPTSGTTTLPLRRSGGLEVETQGNFNALGWIMDLDPDTWWTSANLGNEQNDLISIVHHEIGHAHGFNGAYPQFAAAHPGGLTSPALQAYNGGPVAIDASDHFDATIDPSSGFGVFGNDYHGTMPARRWIPTRLDVLALEAVGYPLRPLTFERWIDSVPDCP
jgi:hypothetical protein